MDSHGLPSLGAANHAQDSAIELGARPEQGSPLDRPGRDLDEPTGWGPTIRSAHIMKDGKRRRDLARAGQPPGSVWRCAALMIEDGLS